MRRLCKYCVYFGSYDQETGLGFCEELWAKNGGKDVKPDEDASRCYFYTFDPLWKEKFGGAK